jgi:SAM-dependent methyltransferase
MTKFDQNFWNERYQNDETRWDLGTVSPPIAQYTQQLPNKNISILIPGCGNTYEAAYLLEAGFTNITILDIAPLLVEKLKAQYQHNPHIKVVQGDFFEQQGNYDLIIEQTFFCALSPELRPKYAQTMHRLLNPNGLLVGLLFNRTFDNDFPPFGGNIDEYRQLFSPYFRLKHITPCYNSYPARQGTELFIELEKI